MSGRRALQPFCAVGLKVALGLATGLVLASCKQEQPSADSAPAALPVKAMTVVQRKTPIFKEFVGEVRGSQEVTIRARVGGIVTGKHFEDGSQVQKGALLYTIDPREYRAQVAQAQAQLASAEAAASQAQLDVARYRPLVAENAISKQVYDNAVAAARQSNAQVAALRANVQAASLSLEFANVTAPLTGRIGDSDVFEGSLVTAGQTVLGKMSVDDPVWVYFSVSESGFLDYQRRNGVTDVTQSESLGTVQLTNSNGEVYPHAGHIDFADRALDPTSGTYRIRATFPNPEGRLKAGMFARVRLTGQTLEDAIVVPERAVTQQLGSYFVVVVGKDGKAVQRPVTPGPRQAGMWVISEGLQPGDKIVVEGLQKARPGTPLKVTDVTEADLKSNAPTGD